MRKYLLVFLLLNTCFTMVNAQQNTNEEKYHEFDFWIGKWDVTKVGEEHVSGKSEIVSIIDGVGILENYSVVNGKYSGKSLNKYNPAKNRWEQYWIDNSGLTLFLSGGIIDGKMVLTDLETGDSTIGYNQIIWQKLDDGSVRQTWNVSKDHGKTWTSVFDGIYTRRED